MKTKHLFYITVLLLAAIFSISFAQDNTQLGLPEGAIARLGKGGINIMRFSPDGTRLIVGTDVCVWLYDILDGNGTALFTNEPGHINAFAFSQDGKILASSGADNPIIQMWEFDTSAKLHSITLTQRYDSVVALAFHDTKFISLDRRGQIVYWDVETGNKLSETGNVPQFDAMAFSEDGKVFAIGTQNGKIHLWDATSVSRQKTLIGHARLFGKDDNEIHALAFSPDGKILASGSEDKTVQLWNTENHTKITTLKGHQGWVTTLAFSKDGKTIASGDASKEIKIWDIETKKIRKTLNGHNNTIVALTFVPENAPKYSGCLASGSADGTIRFWNPDTGEELLTFTTGHTKWVKAIAFSENDTTLASAAVNGTVEIWSLKTRQELTTFTAGQSDTTGAVSLSPDAKFFASQGGGKAMVAFYPFGSGAHIRGGGSDNFQVWEIATGRELPVPLQRRGPRTIAPIFSSDNEILAASDIQGIRIWQTNTGIEMFHLNPIRPLHSGQLVFSPDGKRFAAVRSHDKPQVWDVATQNDITPPNMGPTEVLAFSPDGVTVATASAHGIHLWKLDATKEDAHTKLPGRLWGLHIALTFSPDGNILVGSEGERIKLIDAVTGKEYGTLTGHTEPIEALVFSHDGKTLASSSMDGTVLLWDWEKVTSKIDF